MSKGLIIMVAVTALGAMLLGGAAEAEIYKVVDKDGNVTFTDQRPSADAQPVELPPLSVIESDIEVPDPAAAQGGAESEEKPLTPRELRRKYRDFRITSPQQEETFWGTANTVVVNWSSSAPLDPGMNVRLYVDGQAQDTPPGGGVSLTLDRGEHQVYAELLDAGGRRIVATEPVTFFIKQHSAFFNPGGAGGG